MRKTIFRRLLLCGVFALTIVSCEDAENTSVPSSFSKFPVTPASPVILAEFNSGPVVIDFSTNEKQITEIHLEIAVGSSSTATEGEDFILDTHSVDLVAFQGQDSFPVSITILDDTEPEEDETIYLTFFTEVPSGVIETDVLVVTIKGCTEPVPTDDLFIGSYTVTSTAGDANVGGGAPVFANQTVTLAYEGSGKRSFNAVYLGSLGVGNPTQEWTLLFDACNGDGFVFKEDDTNLACGAIPIRLKPITPFGTTDIVDDNEFTVVLTEYEPDAADACGADGTTAVTLTFTKL